MKCVGAGKHLRTCRAVLKSKTVVPHCDLLHLFPVCPAEGSRPHIIIKGRTFLVWMLLCVCVCTDSTWLCTVCVCVCVHVHMGMQRCMYGCSICMWAYGHLHVRGASLRWSLTCAAVIVVTSYHPHYRKFSRSSRQSRRWLLLMPVPLHAVVCLSLFPPMRL